MHQLPWFADIFNVYLLPSSSLSVFGECLLQVTEDQLRLLHLDSAHTEIASWPLIALRRFGKDESKFTFECGRLVFDDTLFFLEFS